MIDFYASNPWYVDHVAPIWRALPPEARGTFHVTTKSAEAARGLPNATSDKLSTSRRPLFVVSYGDLRAATMNGRTMIALGQHGAGQSYSTDHPAYPGGRSQGAASLFLVPNRHAEMRTRAAYPRARVERTGCPKLDTLPGREPDGQLVVALSFHWDGPAIAPEMRSAWLHYRRALGALTRRYRVIGHAHPKATARVAPWYRASHVELVPSFEDVLRRADVYACDNSSSLFEFAATGRPVVVLNAPWFRRNVEHGLRFWEASGIGVNAEGPHDLAAAVAAAVADAPATRAAREAALDLVYDPRTGGAQRSAEVLVDWARTVRAPQPVIRNTRMSLDRRRAGRIVSRR